jgi:hypothetical protein
MSKRSEEAGHAHGVEAGPETGAGLPEQSLEKIREILFGERVRVQEDRLARFEETLHRELQGVRTEVQRRIEAIEVRAKKDNAELERKLLESEREGILGREQLARDIDASRRLLEERLVELAERSEKNVEFIQEHVASENKALAGTLGRKHDELAQAIDRTLGELRSEKADRAALAAVFSDLATRLAESAKKLRNE